MVLGAVRVRSGYGGAGGACAGPVVRGGPALGRPLVDTLTGSSLLNLKELRPGSRGRSELRLLFVFDPDREAIFSSSASTGCGCCVTPPGNTPGRTCGESPRQEGRSRVKGGSADRHRSAAAPSGPPPCPGRGPLPSLVGGPHPGGAARTAAGCSPRGSAATGVRPPAAFAGCTRASQGGRADGSGPSGDDQWHQAAAPALSPRRACRAGRRPVGQATSRLRPDRPGGGRSNAAGDRRDGGCLLTDDSIHHLADEADLGSREDTDAIEVPTERTLYRLFDKLAASTHATGSAATRRSVHARPAGPFGEAPAIAPGELMQGRGEEGLVGGPLRPLRRLPDLGTRPPQREGPVDHRVLATPAPRRRPVRRNGMGPRPSTGPEEWERGTPHASPTVPHLCLHGRVLSIATLRAGSGRRSSQVMADAGGTGRAYEPFARMDQAQAHVRGLRPPRYVVPADASRCFRKMIPAHGSMPKDRTWPRVLPKSPERSARPSRRHWAEPHTCTPRRRVRLHTASPGLLGLHGDRRPQSPPVTE